MDPLLQETKTQIYPVLLLRDIFVFRSIVVPLFVGRDKSVRALEEVVRREGKILLATQKSGTVDDPREADIYRMGTLGNILQLLRLPDGTVKVLVEGVARARIRVIPVGAEESLFTPQPWPHKPADAPLELAFFGTFIGLQGVDVLAQAILHYDGAPTHWRLIGEGPMKAECERLLAPLAGATGPSRVSFEGWGPLPELPGRLASADAILGIFGTSDKALRVIPNKVYQGLAIGRAVLTAATPAFTPELRADENNGLLWAIPGNPDSIRTAVERLHQRRSETRAIGAAARSTYEQHFSNLVIRDVLSILLTADTRPTAR